MDSSAVGANVQAQALQSTGIYAMKKADQVTADTVATLLGSVQRTAPTYNNPPNLGSSIDVRA